MVIVSIVVDADVDVVVSDSGRFDGRGDPERELEAEGTSAHGEIPLKISSCIVGCSGRGILFPIRNLGVGWDSSSGDNTGGERTEPSSGAGDGGKGGYGENVNDAGRDLMATSDEERECVREKVDIGLVGVFSG